MKFVTLAAAAVLLASINTADAGLLLINYGYQRAFTFQEFGRAAAMSRSARRPRVRSRTIQRAMQQARKARTARVYVVSFTPSTARYPSRKGGTSKSDLRTLV